MSNDPQSCMILWFAKRPHIGMGARSATTVIVKPAGPARAAQTSGCQNASREWEWWWYQIQQGKSDSAALMQPPINIFDAALRHEVADASFADAFTDLERECGAAQRCCRCHQSDQPKNLFVPGGD